MLNLNGPLVEPYMANMDILMYYSARFAGKQKFEMIWCVFNKMVFWLGRWHGVESRLGSSLEESSHAARRKQYEMESQLLELNSTISRIADDTSHALDVIRQGFSEMQETIKGLQETGDR